MLLPVFAPTIHPKERFTKKVPFFVRRWSTLKNLSIHVDRDIILTEAWNEFVSENQTHLGLEELQNMVRSFLMAIPSVQYLAGKIPETLIKNTVTRHTETMLTRLIGDNSERMEVKLNFHDFKVVFPSMFVITSMDRERPHVDADSTLHGLEELDKSLEPFSAISVMGNHTNLQDNIIISILMKPPSQRLFQEITFLIELVKDSFHKYNLSPPQLRSIFMNLKLLCVGAGDFLCQEGDAGREFYVLFYGLISVKKSGSNARYQSEVGEIQSGTAFGELSLMSKTGIRNAALMAKRDCILGMMNESDFRLYMYPYVHKIHKEKQHFFEKLPYFKKAPLSSIFDISHSSRIRTVLPKTVIYQQNQSCPNVILFVKSGHIRVVRELLPSYEEEYVIGNEKPQKPRHPHVEARRKSILARMNSSVELTGDDKAAINATSPKSPLKLSPEASRQDSDRHRLLRGRTVALRRQSINDPEVALQFFAAFKSASDASTAAGREDSNFPLRSPRESVNYYKSSQVPIHVQVALLGPWSAIGGALTMNSKKRAPVPASFIALDHVVLFEVSIFDILRQLDDKTKRLLSANVFHCPVDDNIREMLSFQDQWRKYRKNIRKKRYFSVFNAKTLNSFNVQTESRTE